MPDKAIFGRYWAGTSVVHRMDARAKFLLMLALIVAVFCSGGYAGLCVCAVFVSFAYKAANIPLRASLASIAPLLPIVILSALANLLFVQGEKTFFSWWVICISECGLVQAAFIGSRLVILLFIVSLFTLTTSTLDITDAFEHLLAPASRLGVPAHELSMIMSIALRFLPQFAWEFTLIYRAQISRGAAFSGSLAARARMLSSFIVPLFTSAFRHADTLSLGMDARCYHGGTQKSRLHPLRYSRLDAYGAFFCVFALVLVIATNIVF